jgi:hypothetical protein
MNLHDEFGGEAEALLARVQSFCSPGSRETARSLVRAMSSDMTS